MPEFVDKDGLPLFPNQIEVDLKMNGWNHCSLLRERKSDDAVATTNAMTRYTARKRNVTLAQKERFRRSLDNGIVPRLMWDGLRGAWSIGGASLDLPKIGDTLIARAKAWQDEVIADVKGKIRMCVHYNTTPSALVRCITYSWRSGVSLPANFTIPVTEIGSALYDADRAKTAMFDILGLHRGDWREVGIISDSFPGVFSYYGGYQKNNAVRTLSLSGTLRKDRSYIISPSDSKGELLLFEGPMCDFVIMHFGLKGSQGMSTGYSITGTCDAFDLNGAKLYTSSTHSEENKGSVCYEGPTLYRTASAYNPEVVPPLPFGAVGAVASDARNTHFTLPNWVWSLSGYSDVVFHSVSSLILENGVLTGRVSVANCRLPVMEFRDFIQTCGRQENGEVLPSLAKALKDLDNYLDGVFMVTAGVPDAIPSESTIRQTEMLSMASEAGKMNEVINGTVTLESGVKRLLSDKAKSKKYTSYAFLYDEALSLDEVLSDAVVSLLQKGNAGDAVITVTTIGSATELTARGIGLLTAVEAQYLIAYGAPVQGSSVADLVSGWGLPANWDLDIRMYGTSQLNQDMSKPMNWFTVTNDGAKEFKPSAISTYRGFPQYACNLVAKQMLCKGLSQDGSEQVLLPLFISPLDVIAG